MFASLHDSGDQVYTISSRAFNKTHPHRTIPKPYKSSVLGQQKVQMCGAGVPCVVCIQNLLGFVCDMLGRLAGLFSMRGAVTDWRLTPCRVLSVSPAYFAATLCRGFQLEPAVRSTAQQVAHLLTSAHATGLHITHADRLSHVCLTDLGFGALVARGWARKVA